MSFSKSDVAQSDESPSTGAIILEENLANTRMARHLVEAKSTSSRKYCEFSIIFDDAGDASWLPKGSLILKTVILKLKTYPSVFVRILRTSRKETVKP